MPHKGKQGSLGRALIKERFGGRRRTSGNDASSQHMREYTQIADPETLNLKSVTELSSLDDFLETAELAGTEFTAERMNIQYVHTSSLGLPSDTENRLIKEAQEMYKDSICIPRRPKWNEKMSADELNSIEKESFLQWRRHLAEIKEKDHVTLTPYEKNLDFWRQLWRVIERSDLVVQIVDARDPLLYRCEDLEKYVKDTDSKKENMILVNKADLLSQKQREDWAKYFDKEGSVVAFWSATLEAERGETLEEDSDCENDDNISYPAHNCNNPSLLTKRELIKFFKSRLPNLEGGIRTIGMVGYPNVGKSSTINTIMQEKKVAVSATPGRTKHFQTLYIKKDLLLCDCPGLVFPSFVTNKAEMLLSGILSIDEMRQHVAPVNLICKRVPRKVLEITYGINIPKPLDGEDESRHPTSQELLDSYGLMRGFMTSRGQPDNPRSARVILKDYVKGKLLHCKAPPGANQEEFSSWNDSIIHRVAHPTDVEEEDAMETTEEVVQLQKKAERIERQEKLQPVSAVDYSFFSAQNVKAFTKGALLGQVASRASKGGENVSKPWRKHNNRKKKEKVRRTRSQILV